MPQYLLIDGQQRLTTVSLILLALRTILKTFDADVERRDSLLRQIHRLLSNEATDLFVHKLLPTTTRGDRDVYMDLVEGVKGPVSKSGMILEAYNFFLKNIRQIIVDVEKADAFLSALKFKLTFVSVELEDYENPYTIFETLNHRGAPLQQTDLIRNYLFMLLENPKSQQVAHDDYWKPLASYFGQTELKKSKKLNDFFRFFLSFCEQRIINDSEIYMVVKKTVDKKNVNEFWKKLQQAFDRYRRFVSPELETNPLVRERLHRLNTLKITTHFSLMLSLFEEYEEKRMTAEMLAETLAAIETFLVRDYVQRLASDGLNKEMPLVFGKAQRYVREENMDLVTAVKTALASISFYRSDETFVAGLMKTPLYTYSGFMAKLILFSVEKELSGRELRDKDWDLDLMMSEISLSTWSEMLTMEERSEARDVMHTLGNIILVPKNRKTGYRSFSEKKNLLLTEYALATNEYFRDVPRWNVAAIKERAHFIARQALKIWPDFGVERRFERDWTRVKPEKLTICGQTTYPKTWKEVYIDTLNGILDFNPAAFNKIADFHPNRFTYEERPLSSSHAKLKNGMWALVNYSSKDLYEKSRESVELAGIDLSEWKVDFA
jgi:hypothetical protein